MKYTSLCYTAALTLLVGCSGNKDAGKQLDELITIDVTAEYPEKELILQDFMDVEYIPLDNSDEYITQGVVKAVGKEHILAKNWKNDGDIFVFDRNTGNGIRKINRKGGSGEEYTGITDIILDEDNKEMFIVNNSARVIVVYDLMGDYKRKLQFADSCYYENVSNYDQDHLIAYKSYPPQKESEQSSHVYISKKDGSIARELSIDITKVASPVFIKGDLTVMPGFDLIIPATTGWMLTRCSSDSIYSVDSKGNLYAAIKRIPSIHEMDPQTFLFPILDSDRYLLLQTLLKEVDLTTFKGFPSTLLVYDREEKNVSQCTVYNSDYVNKQEVNFWWSPINPRSNEVAFCIKLDAPDLVEAYENGELKGRLKEIASTLEEDSNPVIMLLKNKK
ncbi:MAG: 6-bladed beta-propeller [Tannerellaceae bacterium]